jgi:hypothetical protein
MSSEDFEVLISPVGQQMQKEPNCRQANLVKEPHTKKIAVAFKETI